MVKMLGRWLPAVFWMLIIWQFSAQPTLMATKVDWLDFVMKKSAHLVEYFVLFLLLYRALEIKNRPQMAFLLGLMFAFSDEMHQMFTPGRTSKLRDVLIFDGSGLVIGWLAVVRIKLLEKWLKK